MYLSQNQVLLLFPRVNCTGYQHWTSPAISPTLFPDRLLASQSTTDLKAVSYFSQRAKETWDLEQHLLQMEFVQSENKHWHELDLSSQLEFCPYLLTRFNKLI